MFVGAVVIDLAIELLEDLVKESDRHGSLLRLELGDGLLLATVAERMDDLGVELQDDLDDVVAEAILDYLFEDMVWTVDQESV